MRKNHRDSRRSLICWPFPARVLPVPQRASQCACLGTMLVLRPGSHARRTCRLRRGTQTGCQTTAALRLVPPRRRSYLRRPMERAGRSIPLQSRAPPARQPACQDSDVRHPRLVGYSRLDHGHRLPDRSCSLIRSHIFYTDCMERICSNCHAVLATGTKADWCPACGGSIVERPALPQNSSESPLHAVVVDHRGIALPRRHAVGGIITPQ